AAEEYVRIIEEYYKQPNLPENIAANKNIAFANAYISSSCAHLKGKRLRSCIRQLKKAKEYNSRVHYLTIVMFFVRALLVRIIHKVTWVRVIVTYIYSKYRRLKNFIRKHSLGLS